MQKMRPTSLEDLPRPALRQRGVFTRDQALAEGWTPRQVRRRVAHGRWVPVLGDGLVEAGPPVGHVQRCWAAHVTWPERVISHRSAALLLGWPVAEPTLVDIVGPQHHYPARGLRLRCAPVGRHEIGLLDRRLLVTGERRTMVDCLGEPPIDQALDLYAWLTSRRLVDRAVLLVDLRERAGRQGTGQLREVLRLTRGGAVSGGEYRLHQLLLRAGITGWQANVRLTTDDGRAAIADVYFAAERLVIEFDGRRAHSGRDAFVRDRRRQNALQRSGLLVLRYTWDDLVDRAEALVAEVRQVLAQRRP